MLTDSKLITLVRHGQLNVDAGLYGHTNVALSTTGREQLLHTLTELHLRTPITKITSSPLIRCAEIAEQFSSQHDIPYAQYSDIQEIFFGEWDGKTFNELAAEWQKLEAFFNAPDRFTPPKGETLHDFAERVISCWNELIQETVAHQLIVTHGGVIKLLIAHCLQLDWRNASLFAQLHIDYASTTRIEIALMPDAKPIIRWIGASI